MVIASIRIIENYFYNGRGAWGAYFDFELSTHAFLEKNVFEKGTAQTIGSAYEDHIGTGSIMIISGLSEKVNSIYLGFFNLYIDCWSENKGKIISSYYKKKNYLGSFGMFGAEIIEENSLFISFFFYLHF